MDKTNTTSLLASFATLKTLSETKKHANAYQLLSEFVCYIISTQKIHLFSAIEMKNQLQAVFSFDIPEAVVATSCKSLGCISKNNGLFLVDWSKFVYDPAFEKAKVNAECTQASIISPLATYIREKYPNHNPSDEVVTQALIAFLVGDPQNGFSKYFDAIGEFILKNEQSADIQASLDAIQEGSIWYIGINHNINETGSITRPLTLFLGTEILFSLKGYNGEVHKQLADDFFAQVKTANINGERIKLRYFSKTKEEIDSFFRSAILIREGQTQASPTVAMKTILRLCATATDVSIEMADFYHHLQYTFGILEDDKKDYYSPAEYEYNLESLEYEREEDKESWLFVSHINKRRRGKVAVNNIDAEYLYVTNTRNTLKASDAQADKVKRENCIERVNDYAVSLSKVTNILWYKLGNGFGRKGYPCSINPILKARVVLASSISHNVAEVYEKSNQQYKNGEISKEQLVARIITLHKKPILPEELEGDSIDECMNFSPEYMSRYEEETKSNKLALEEMDAQLKEKDKLLQQQSDAQIKQIQKISEEAAHQLQIKDDTIAQKDLKIQETEDQKKILVAELEGYRQKETISKQRKELLIRIVKFTISILWKIAGIALISGVGIYCEKKFDSMLPLYICAAVDAIGLFVLGRTTVKKDVAKYFPKEDK